MEFEKLVRIITKTWGINSQKFFYDLSRCLSKAKKEYRKRYETKSSLKSLKSLNAKMFLNQKIAMKYKESLYTACLYWINEAEYPDIERVKNVFEEEGLQFIGDKIKVNFYLLLKTTFPDEYDVNDGAIYMNAVLNTEEIMITSSIPDRITYDPERTLFYSEFERFWIDGMEMCVPYKEICGMHQDFKFYEDENIDMTYLPCEDFNPVDLECKDCPQKQNIKKYLVDDLGVYIKEEFDEKVEQKRADALRRGFATHPAKLKINKFRKTEINPDAGEYRLAMEFGCSGYLEHLVYQDVLKKNKQAQQDFIKDINDFPGHLPFNERDTVWSRAGGGIWLVTKDNYLMVSYRGETVHEVPRVISYSSSGGFDRKIWNSETKKYEDNTPVKNMKREVLQELNIEEKNIGKIEIVSFGVDLLGGPWMQFSFFAECSLSRNEIMRVLPRARDKHEFKCFFIPFTADAVKALLLKANLEAGADYSLYELYEMRLMKNGNK